MQIPKLDKVVINVACGEAKDNEKIQEAVRSALYDAYKGNSGVILLEADRGLSSDNDLRTACCYAFADYLYDLAKESLGGETEEGNDYYTVFPYLILLKTF